MRLQTRAEEGFQVPWRLRLQRAEVWIQPAQEQRPPLRIRPARPEAAHGGFLEDVVAAEDLVGAFAGKHDLEAVVAYLAGKEVQRRRRRAQDRPLGVADHLVKAGSDVAAFATER